MSANVDLLHEAAPAHERVPTLYVDLDGTFLLVDALHESLARCMRRDPLGLLLFAWWLIRHGRAGAKARLAARSDLDCRTLPVNAQMLALCQAWRRSGGRVVLASASSEAVVRQVACAHSVFDDALASSAEHNLKGEAKLAVIRQHCGGRPFAYCGDSMADIPVLQAACERYVVSRNGRVIEALTRRGLDVTGIDAPRAGIGTFLGAIRLHQWLKNLLVFVPWIAAHRWGDTGALARLATLFIAFGLVASATYLLNDVADLDSDRRHPRKRHRAIAAGTLPVAWALVAAAIMLVAGFALAIAVSPAGAMLLAGYVAATLLYSLVLKTYALVDVIVLAGLYTLRLAVGGIAASVPLSAWLVAFSVATFLSLALVKRCAELRSMALAGRVAAAGRDYEVDDLGFLSAMGIAAGYAAVLLLALYVDSPVARSMYERPEQLWLACPFMLYWLSRLWLKTGRGEMHDDPIVFTLRDRGSRLTLAAAALVFASSQFPAIL